MNESFEEQLKSLETSAKEIEINTLHKMQEKFVGWIKTSISLFVVLVGLIAFLGYKETLSYKRNLDKAVADFKKTQEEFDVKKNELTNKMTEFSTKLSEAEEAANKSLNDTAKRLEELEEVKTELEQNRAVLKSISATSGEAAKILKEVKKQQNSFYNISIAFQGGDGTDVDRSTLLTQFRRALKDEGYVTLPENVYTTSVDRTEIIYFDADEPRQISELSTILSSHVKLRAGEKIETKFVENRSPREVLIKIRIDGSG